MWFRRRRKSGTNTEHSGTLRSPREPGPPGAKPRGRKAHPSRDVVSSLTPGEKNISNAVASDEHMEWDFKVDLAADEASGEAPGNGESDALRVETNSGSKVPRVNQVVSMYGERGTAAEPHNRAARTERVDNIPVLNNIVYLPKTDDTGGVEPDAQRKSAPFVEQCLKDIRKRLKRHEMTPLTPDQEQRFRTALTALLVQKTSGKFET